MLKTCVKLHISVQTSFTGNSNALFKLTESLQNLKESFIFSIFLCVRIKINFPGSNLLLNTGQPRYLKVQGNGGNTSRYPKFDIAKM